MSRGGEHVNAKGGVGSKEPGPGSTHAGVVRVYNQGMGEARLAMVDTSGWGVWASWGGDLDVVRRRAGVQC